MTARLAGLALVCCGVAGAQGVASRNVTAAPRPKLSGRPFPVTFVDVARDGGLTHRFVNGGETAKKYIIEANGSGVAFVDVDNDGWLDVFVVGGSMLEKVPVDSVSRLYRNTRDGKFEDITERAGVGRLGWGGGVCAGDFDNDGLTDLYVAYWGHNALYRNLGEGKFEDVAAKAGVAGPAAEWSSGCTFADYDRDGKLDLLVTSYQEFDLAKAPPPGKSSNCEWKGMPVFCGPRGLPYGRVTLYRNLDGGRFEDVTKASGVAEARGFYAFTAVAADLNEDGWVDLYVASDSTPSLLFRNNRDGTFSEIGTEAGVAYNEHGFEQGGMGVAVGDANSDGRLDLMKTNFAGDHPNLYLNQGQGIFEDRVIPAGLGVNPQYVGWGVGFVDLDNDGWPDVFQVNGHVYPELGEGKSGEAYRNPRLVYRNLGGGRFEDVSELAGPGVAARHSSRGAAFGDFDNDGDIDVLVMNMGEPPSLLRNDLKSSNHWVRLRLEGSESNRSAIAALVELEAGGRKQVQAVLSQSSFLSQNDLRLHFGLGGADEIERVSVRWPNGKAEQFSGVKPGATWCLVEGSGEAKSCPPAR
jgi:enediyne biosynthesis protein E4